MPACAFPFGAAFNVLGYGSRVGPHKPDSQHEVFIAHASADLVRAEEFRRRLTALGCDAVLDADYLIGGDAWDDRLIAAQRQARVTAVLLSGNVEPGNAMLAYYLKEEIALGIRLMREHREHRVVPIDLGPVEIAPYGLNRLHRWRAFDDIGLQTAAAELVASLREPDTGRTPAIVGAVPTISETFVGRDELLLELDRADRTSLVTQSLTGMGGVGKSSLAAAYARGMEHVFDVVWWVRAETTDGLETDLETLAARLGLDGSDRSLRAEAAIRWVETTTRPWLIVFDNAARRDLIERWLPKRGPGQVIVTSRDRNLRQLGRVINVGLFDDEVAERFLRDRVREENPAAAEESDVSAVVSVLRGLPLALEQAGAWVARNPSRTWHAYRELFDRADRDPFPGATRPSGYDATATTTWQVSITTAVAESAIAPKILAAASFLSPDGIPLDLFVSEGSGSDAYLAVPDFEIADALDVLHGYSLIDIATDSFSVHRIVQHASRRVDDVHAFEFMVRRLADELPHETSRPEAWTRSRSLLPHVLAADEFASADPDTVSALAYCLGRLGSFLQYSGSVREAVPIFERAVTRRIEVGGERHADTIAARANLAGSLRSAGRVDDAIALEVQVLAESTELFGDLDPATLTSRANLAASYWSAGRFDEAIDLLEQVLANRVTVLGDRHPSTLNARANLAMSYRSAGLLDEAIDLLEQVLADRVDLLGNEDPSTLTARANLAASYWSAGRIDEGITLVEQALAARIKVLGDRHPDTLTAQANLATAYGRAGRIGEAIALQQQVLADRIEVLGPGHPDSLTSLADLALSDRSAGRLDDAIALLRQAIAGADGPGHPNVEVWAHALEVMVVEAERP